MQVNRPYAHLQREKKTGTYYLFMAVKLAAGWELVGVAENDSARTGNHYGAGNYQDIPGSYNITIKVRKNPAIQFATYILDLKVDPLVFGGNIDDPIDIHVTHVNNGQTIDNFRGRTVVVYEHADEEGAGG